MLFIYLAIYLCIFIYLFLLFLLENIYFTYLLCPKLNLTDRKVLRATIDSFVIKMNLMLCILPTQKPYIACTVRI